MSNVQDMSPLEWLHKKGKFEIFLFLMRDPFLQFFCSHFCQKYKVALASHLDINLHHVYSLLKGVQHTCQGVLAEM